jgi:hypothetical protein
MTTAERERLKRALWPIIKETLARLAKEVRK